MSYEVTCNRCDAPIVDLDGSSVLTPENEWLCLKCAEPVIEAHARAIVGRHPFFAPWQAIVRFVRKALP